MEKTFQTTIFKPKKTKILAIFAIVAVITLIALFLTLLLPNFSIYVDEFNNHVCNTSYCRKFTIPCPKNYASTAFKYAYNNVINLIVLVFSVPVGVLLLGIVSKLLICNYQKNWTLTSNQILIGKKTINLSDITKASHIPAKCCKKANAGFNGTILITLGNNSIVLKYPPKQNEDGIKAAEYILSFFDNENYSVDLNNDTMKYSVTKNVKKAYTQQSTSTVDDINLF